MDIFFNIASGSSIPNIVHKKNIIKTNSIKQTLSSLGSILAPSIGVIPMPYLVLKCFNLDSTQYGIIQSGISIGAVIAAILLSIIPLPEKKFKLVMYSSLVFCAPFILLGIGAIMNMIHISKSILFVYMVVVTFLYGSGTVLINVPTNAIQQENIENSYLGRVLGFQNTFGRIITPVAMLLSGKLIGIVAPYILPLISGGVFIILVIVTCSNKTMKEI